MTSAAGAVPMKVLESRKKTPLEYARDIPRHELEEEFALLFEQVTALQNKDTAALFAHRLGKEAAEELLRAQAKFPPAGSAHGAHSVLREEFEELWDLVKLNPKKAGLSDDEYRAKMRAEAIQVAAMALRFVQDECDRSRP